MFYRLAMRSIRAGAGISTDKIGVLGLMGLDELTNCKWRGIGSGQVRT